MAFVFPTINCQYFNIIDISAGFKFTVFEAVRDIEIIPVSALEIVVAKATLVLDAECFRKHS